MTEEKKTTLREALANEFVYNVYFKEGGSPIDRDDYDKYLDVTGHFETYDDHDGFDDDGKPIIMHLLWFFLDITENQKEEK